eukprot:29138-Hanusia_phi.AAC.3
MRNAQAPLPISHQLKHVENILSVKRCHRRPPTSSVSDSPLLAVNIIIAIPKTSCMPAVVVIQVAQLPVCSRHQQQPHSLRVSERKRSGGALSERTATRGRLQHAAVSQASRPARLPAPMPPAASPSLESILVGPPRGGGS